VPEVSSVSRRETELETVMTTVRTARKILT
jgi:hypothetical protein